MRSVSKGFVEELREESLDSSTPARVEDLISLVQSESLTGISDGISIVGELWGQGSLCKEIQQITSALVELDVVNRLSGRLHTPSMFFTSLSRDGKSSERKYFKMDRLTHSLGVAEESFNLLSKVGCSDYKIKVGYVAGLLHDIGHIAFAHTGEVILANRGVDTFDHDLNTLILASCPEVRKVITEAGIRHEDVLACLGASELQNVNKLDKLRIMQGQLKAKNLSYKFDFTNMPGWQNLLEEWYPISVLVQDYADTFAYMITDNMGCPEGGTRGPKAEAIVEEMRDAIDLVDGQIVFRRLQPIRKFCAFLLDYSQKYPIGFPGANTAEVLTVALSRAKVPVHDLIRYTDSEIVAKLPDDYQKVLAEGTDLFYKPLVKVIGRDNLLAGGSRVDVLSLRNDLRRIVPSRIANNFSNAVKFIFPVTPPLDKKYEGLINFEDENIAAELAELSGHGKSHNRINKVGDKYANDEFLVLFERIKSRRPHLQKREHVAFHVRGERFLYVGARAENVNFEAMREPLQSITRDTVVCALDNLSKGGVRYSKCLKVEFFPK